MSMIGSVEEGYKRQIPQFNIGDTVRVSVKVVEGDKERIQPFDGVVIARRGAKLYYLRSKKGKKATKIKEKERTFGDQPSRNFQGPTGAPVSEVTEASEIPENPES